MVDKIRNKKYNLQTEKFETYDFTKQEKLEAMLNKLDNKKIGYLLTREGIFIEEKDLIEAEKK